jgi:thiamine kinase-like enzyme
MALDVTGIMARAGLAAGGPVTYVTLKGGLSHRVLRVEAGGASYVLRVLDPAVSAAGLGVPAAVEIENTVQAARTGVGPEVLYVEGDAMVLEYIDGVTLGHEDVRKAENIPRLAAACRRLHDGPARFTGDFSVFRKAGELFARCREHDLPVPGGYAEHLPVLARIEEAVGRVPLPSVPCHNDLLPENFIDDGRDVRIVDFQLSGRNDPAFELGDIAAEGDYEPDRVEALASAYFGPEMSEALLARVRLYLIASNVTWTLWFAIHHGLLSGKAADATFDYEAEAADKWAQALRDLTDPGLGRLIDRAAHRRAASPVPPPPSRRH